MRDASKIAIIVGGAGLSSLGLWALTRKVEAHPGNIVLEDLVILPAEVYIGEPVKISVIATNIGGEKATKEIVCGVL